MNNQEKIEKALSSLLYNDSLVVKKKGSELKEKIKNKKSKLENELQQIEIRLNQLAKEEVVDMLLSDENKKCVDWNIDKDFDVAYRALDSESYWKISDSLFEEKAVNVLLDGKSVVVTQDEFKKVREYNNLLDKYCQLKKDLNILDLMYDEIEDKKVYEFKLLDYLKLS